MSATARLDAPAAATGLLDRARTVAKPGFNRWLTPPAALAIHLCIGMIYGMSVFWLPLTHTVGTACRRAPGCSIRSPPRPASGPCRTCWSASRSASCSWAPRRRSGAAGWSASGRAAPASPPPSAGRGGLALAALGVYLHQLWLIWLGMGALGGIGLGLGYISPVSTLVKWFPDRRGMATGMAIMGFGGGAMIGAPLATLLMGHFKATAGAAGGPASGRPSSPSPRSTSCSCWPAASPTASRRPTGSRRAGCSRTRSASSPPPATCTSTAPGRRRNSG